MKAENQRKFEMCLYCCFSLDVTKIQTKKLLILPRFYFHDALDIGILFKLRHYVPISTLKQLYYTLIYPYLMYGLMSWGTAYQTKLNKIKVSQNNCIRCIFFANKRESPTSYFTLLEILKLENIFKLKIGALMHKIQYQKKDTPPALYDLVQPASAVHIIIILGMPLIKTCADCFPELIMA